MSLALDALLVLVFVLIGGVFAATEMALVSLRESQIRKFEGGGATARKVASLARDSGFFLSAVQIGVTFAGFFSSAFGASTIAPQLSPVLVERGVPEGAAGIITLVGMTLVVSYLSLVLGEVVPKRIAMQKAERFSLIAAPPLGVFARVMSPVVWVVNSSSNLLLRLLGFDPAARTGPMSTEEVRDIVTTHEGFGESERGMLADVFEANERLVVEAMKHRSDVAAFPAEASVAEVTAAVVEKSFSRYPVFEGNIDKIIGFIHVRDLLVESNGEREIRDLVREIAFLPGTVKLPQALGQMRAHGHHIAIVIDEYGGTDGIITLEDLLEELVGEIWDEFDLAEKHAVMQLHESRQLDGSINLEDFAEATGVYLPEGPYETVAGWMFSRLGRVAVVGDTMPVPASWTADPDDDSGSRIQYQLEVTQTQGNRITTVRLRKAELEDNPKRLGDDE